MKPSNKSMHLGKKYFPNLSSKYIWGKLFSADFKKFNLSFAFLMLCIKEKKYIIAKHKNKIKYMKC